MHGHIDVKNKENIIIISITTIIMHFPHFTAVQSVLQTVTVSLTHQALLIHCSAKSF
jgi:hypothetical protein